MKLDSLSKNLAKLFVFARGKNHTAGIYDMPWDLIPATNYQLTKWRLKRKEPFGWNWKCLFCIEIEFRRRIGRPWSSAGNRVLLTKEFQAGFEFEFSGWKESVKIFST